VRAQRQTSLTQGAFCEAFSMRKSYSDISSTFPFHSEPLSRLLSAREKMKKEEDGEIKKKSRATRKPERNFATASKIKGRDKRVCTKIEKTEKGRVRYAGHRLIGTLTCVATMDDALFSTRGTPRLWIEKRP